MKKLALLFNAGLAFTLFSFYGCSENKPADLHRKQQPWQQWKKPTSAATKPRHNGANTLLPLVDATIAILPKR